MEETPLEIANKYTQGLRFPASKDQVLDSLQRNGAPDDVVEIVRSKPNETYASPNELQDHLHKEA